MTDTFVHLHLHSEYSLVDSTLRLKPMIAKAKALGMPAIAITDQFNLFALVKFYRAAVAAGIKPIVGADVLIQNPDDLDHPSRLVLLCQNREGYLNLCRLLSRGYLEGQHLGLPYLQREWVTQNSDGLIALSAAREGDIGQALLNNHPNQARQLLKGWQRDFPDRFYIEVQRTGREREAVHEALALQLASDLDCPVVASNDVRFLEESDFDAHDARVCIHDSRQISDKRREQRYSSEQYLKSPDEMRSAFHDLPEALENAVEIARRCNLELEFGKYYLPDFPTPEGEDIESFLRRVSAEGLAELLEAHGPAEGYTVDDYDARLDRELTVINDMGFPGYFLIVADFIRWSKENGIPVGPGRGSGAGSVVAWALGITGLDPLQYDLLFERFLNPERISMPDFDVDFCMDQRDRVIDYVAERYGRNQVSQIITYGTMAAKAVVRDCGRVLGHGYGFVDSIAKLVPLELGITLDKALEAEPELSRRYDEEEDTRALLDLARSLEGLTRNAGKHAGGVVIAPSDLTDFSPLFCESGGGSAVTQFDKDDVESIGLVKFDFLGLRTLTIIDWALKTINRRRARAGEEPLVLEELPMDDARSFQLLKACQTTAVFQLESRGMKDLIRKLQPDLFDEIIALVALFRPGPLESGMVDTYIDVKHGRKPITYPHPKVEGILKPTNGVILYQEQVMQIAQDLAGYSLGDADILRRAMGKKKPEEMAKQRKIFVDGSVARDIPEDKANFIFDQMETFAGYGFNKSHSAAYALISYHTAYLKAHYPAPFMAAVLSADMDNTDKVGELISECRAMNLEVLTPDINESIHHFAAVGDDTIRYGLGALKGVGKGAIESIEEERETRGEFTSLGDFCVRVDLQKVNKRALETLIRSGAMDPLDENGNRARMLSAMEPVLRSAEQAQRNKESGQSDMFGSSSSDELAPIEIEIPDLPPWPELQRLQAEKEALGLFLTGHPALVHRPDTKRFTTSTIGRLDKLVPSSGDGKRRNAGVPMTLCGLVCATRRVGRRLFTTIEDEQGRMDIGLYDEAFALYGELLRKDEMIVVEGKVSVDDFNGGYRMTANKVMSLSDAKARFARGVRISLQGPCPDFADELNAAFAPYRNGVGKVFLSYRNPRAVARMQLGEEWKVNPCEELVAALSTLPGVTEARLIY